MVLDVDSLLDRHEQLWAQRVEVLECWHEAWAGRAQAESRLERGRRAREADLVRVSNGLSSRQRAWAARHSTYESRPRDRVGRQVLVTWTYRRNQIEAAEAKWSTTLEHSREALLTADMLLAGVTHEVLATWETQAPRLTGLSQHRLLTLAGRTASTVNQVSR